MRNHGAGAAATREESEPASPRRGDMALTPEQVFREVPALFQVRACVRVCVCVCVCLCVCVCVCVCNAPK